MNVILRRRRAHHRNSFIDLTRFSASAIIFSRTDSIIYNAVDPRSYRLRDTRVCVHPCVRFGRRNARGTRRTERDSSCGPNNGGNKATEEIDPWRDSAISLVFRDRKVFAGDSVIRELNTPPVGDKQEQKARI